MFEHEYGDVCPCLKIARRYNLDYGDVLMIADWIIHERSSPHLEAAFFTVKQMTVESQTRFWGDIWAVQHRYDELSSDPEAHKMVFQGVPYTLTPTPYA